MDRLKGLYAISDTALTPYDTLFKQAREAFEKGVRIFQLRDKINPKEKLREIAERMMLLCDDYGVLFVLNDDYRLALELKCALHVGKDELWEIKSTHTQAEIQSLFRQLPYVGVSCYDSLSLAQEAREMGASYVAFGSCFASPTKPSAKTIDLDIFNQARAVLDLPLCAIGGITPQNIHLLAQADMFALISALWRGDITLNTQAFLQNIKDFAHK